MSALQTPPRSLPANASILRRLQLSGVPLEPLAGERLDVHHARIETALMVLFQETRGEQEFQALYDYTRPGVLTWVLGLGKSGTRGVDPMELVQDTFVNIYRYAGSFREQHAKSFRVWSRTIATNVARRLQGRLGQHSLQALPEGLQEPADRRAGPASEAQLTEERTSLRQAWAIVLLQYAAAWEMLSDRDRKALDLVEVQGLSYAQAGRVLDVGISNMKMIMFRSRRRIRTRIGHALAGVPTAHVLAQAV